MFASLISAQVQFVLDSPCRPGPLDHFKTQQNRNHGWIMGPSHRSGHGEVEAWRADSHWTLPHESAVQPFMTGANQLLELLEALEGLEWCNPRRVSLPV
ncbi:hypothetical protein G6O67_001207 [Ophiocordyceps sinensis]|uniref:Uncharacterized protein n=1 Tax=Ophiocordyceps sinensis TaxID=72228 RepID=A0A8H4PWX5_9HYPO|nr:hypothetical protein G6O67_001207 [Ophiocordyceps sinensis]